MGIRIGDDGPDWIGVCCSNATVVQIENLLGRNGVECKSSIRMEVDTWVLFSFDISKASSFAGAHQELALTTSFSMTNTVVASLFQSF